MYLRLEPSVRETTLVTFKVSQLYFFSLRRTLPLSSTFAVVSDAIWLQQIDAKIKPSTDRYRWNYFRRIRRDVFFRMLVQIPPRLLYITLCVCVCSVRYQGCCVVSRPCMCLYCWCSKSVVPQKFMVQLYGALFPFPDCVSRSVRFFSLVNCEKGRPHLVGHFLVMGSIRSRD